MKMLPLLILLTAGTLADARLQNNQGTGANTDFADAVRATVELQSQGLDEATVRVHRAYIYRDSARQWSDDLPGNLKLVAIDVTFQGYSAGLDLDDVDIIDAETSRNYGSDPILFGVLPDGRPADIDDPAVLRREGSLRTCIREPRHLIIRCGREFGEADRYIELDQAMRPLTEPAKLPPFVPRRYFLIDYWVPAGCDTRQLWGWATRQDLEWDLSGLPTATLAALERTEHLEHALHRLRQ